MFRKKAKQHINVNSVSLVDLKAEIARRQVEVKNKSTLLPEGCTVIKANPAAGSSAAIRSLFRKPPKVPPPDPTAADAEGEEASRDRAELERLERSRRTLEAKAKLYEALKSAALGGARTPGGETEEDSAPLVDFERMAMERKAEEDDNSSSSCDDDADESREQDSDRRDHRRDRKPLAEPVSIPDGPITYAHLRKGEVRDHGVGFYAFSADMEQRASEMASLNELHRSTQQARQRAEAARAKRDIQMGQRLAKLRARKGLPDVATAVAQCLGETPDAVEETPDTAQLQEESTQSALPPPSCDLALGSDDLDIASMLRRLRDEAEQRAEEQTGATATPAESHTLPPPPQPSSTFRKRAREWDRGKSMVPAKVFIQREQEEKRNYQFAPPPIYY
uniref:Coiled-coil domain-containing protein 174 n=1 Tax=Schistocephalus solidus TaxID=70667 RepID=A0A0V0J9Y4_SCHSO